MNFKSVMIKGMLSTRGEMLLFADADGATKFADLVKLEEAIKPLIPHGSFSQA